jgi:hypothetical protein
MSKSCFVFFTYILIFSFNLSNAQEEVTKTYKIERVEKYPKIDGVIENHIWGNLTKATGFVQFNPGINIPATKNRKTEVKMFYNDKGIYLSALLYDTPEKVMKQITQRDNFGQTDYFRLVINPNNDAQNDTEFIVFSSGTQADALSSPTLGRDFGWNAVWESAVKHTNQGWQLEMLIPYRSLRFPKTDIQTWGIQFRRYFRRERSEYAWNKINPTKGYEGLYHGRLEGIKDLKPPLRLNLFPFTTAIGSFSNANTETEFKLGMDVKYGITDNITLDTTLIPDFSQARFDNLVLNLGPFEQTFAEQRQFFKEGIELFNRGDLFFSRRVGSAPSGNVELESNEIEIEKPEKVDLINATKISGRLKNGLGIGIFNAITEETTTNVLDTITQNIRQVKVEPLTNYNILVVDKQFNRNSSVTLINTNTTRIGDFRDANVTGALFNLQTKANTYRLSGEAKMSYLNLVDDTQTGISTNLEIAKVFGNYRYSLTHNYADDKYDINDLGLLFRNNYNNFSGGLSYEIFEPTERFQSMRLRFNADYRRLAQPSTYTGLRLFFNFFATNLDLDSYGLDMQINPGKQFDYFEPRVDGQYFITENFVDFGGFISTNYNRTFAFDFRVNSNTFIEDGRDSFYYRINFEPRVRFNDYFFIVYEFNFDKRLNDRGFATFNEELPVFGERDRRIITNSVRANYNFNSYHGLSLQFRHYWDTVLYDDFMYSLNNNGRIMPNQNLPKTSLDDNPDVNFNTWNVDLNYVWQVAPGSFLTVLYRQQLFQNNDFATQNLTDSLNTLFNQNFQHTFSVRLQYFIDVKEAKDALFDKS